MIREAEEMVARLKDIDAPSGEEYVLKVSEHGLEEDPPEEARVSGVYHLKVRRLDGEDVSMYVGRSVNIYNRINQHDDKFRKIKEKYTTDVLVILEIFQMSQESSLVVEPILINKLRPRLNKEFVKWYQKRDESLVSPFGGYAVPVGIWDELTDEGKKEVYAQASEYGMPVKIVAKGNLIGAVATFVEEREVKGRYGVFKVYTFEDSNGVRFQYSSSNLTEMTFPKEEYQYEFIYKDCNEYGYQVSHVEPVMRSLDSMKRELGGEAREHDRTPDIK